MGNRLTFWSKGPAIGLGNGADAMSKQTKIERLKAAADAAWEAERAAQKAATEGAADAARMAAWAAARMAAWEATWAAREAEGE